MALSYFTESEAPRDFRISSTDSDGHYKKCLLCYTVKKNFYCPECIRAGNFVPSSMPYSDRYAEKQAKLLRLKANRRHVLDRCEKLLSPKIKQDTLLTETKQSRDKIDLLRLAIEQRKSSIDEKRKKLAELKQQNNELSLKLPRYQKRVSSLGKHAQSQRMELRTKINMFTDQAQTLAALRRARIRQLTKYIFPVYMTYDSSDSIEDLEFLGDDIEEEPQKRAQLHIVAPWINADADFSHVEEWENQNKEAAPALACAERATPAPPRRAEAALALAAQLVALLALALDVRLPHALQLHEYWATRATGRALERRARWLGACAGALCARAALRPPAPPAPAAPAPAPAPLAALHALCVAAAADAPPLGRVEAWMSNSTAAAWEAWEEACGAVPPDDAEPEHLHWPEALEMEELSCTPPTPAPAASLMTSTVASIASMWRGWTK